MKKVMLTGDRPSGNLHIGHYAGSLCMRLELQESGEYEMFILIADLQALTDNFENPQKIRASITEIMLDYLAVGLDPKKVNFALQSSIPALFELPMYYANLVTQARLERNPTVKDEIKQRGFSRDVPVGFVTYPISQAADITAFGADLVPVGGDQAPMLEQAREIVSAFNRIYNTDALTMPEVRHSTCKRLVGTDGNAKMSKSLNNCIYLKDTELELKAKVMSMYTDPNHIRVDDPGKVEGNAVFTYLDFFVSDGHFEKYLPEYKNLDELKTHYRRGGLGDVKIKIFLFNVLNDLLKPMRERRATYTAQDAIKYLTEGTAKAVAKSNEVLGKVRASIGINVL
jgi:tryptophanyl-tRNA synthetase